MAMSEEHVLLLDISKAGQYPVDTLFLAPVVLESKFWITKSVERITPL